MRLEVYIPDNTTRLQSANLTIRGKGKDVSELVVYPFVPQYTSSSNTPTRVFIEPRYGDRHTIKDITIKTKHKPKYETYSCVLKKGGVANAVEILGDVRPEFWDEMVNGYNVFYGWTFSTVGEKNTISSVDEENSTVYLTNNILGSVGSDTTGSTVKFGAYFKDDISESDYVTYGAPWWVNAIGTNFIYTVPAAQYGSDYTLNLDNVTFENAGSHVSLSMGSFKVNMSGAEVAFKKGTVPLSLFARSYAGGQRLTVNAETTLLVEEAGDLLAGALYTEPSGNYGAGGYIHDSVIVKCHGQLRLINNVSASWRQYSSSYGPDTGGEYSYYADIYERGSGEYGMLMSNTMPTVIDTIDATGQILMRHDTTINGGEVTILSVQGTDYSLTPTVGVFNELTINGYIDVTRFAQATLTDCIYELSLFSQVQVVVNPCPNTLIVGGSIVNGGSVSSYTEGNAISGSEGSRFIYGVNGALVTIDGLTIPALYFSFISGTTPQSPFYQKDFVLTVDNCDVNCSGFMVDGVSVAGGVSNTIIGTNTKIVSEITQHRGKGFIQNIQGKQGTIEKTILSSATYLNIGTVSNVLEIDFGHDVYETNGTINAIIAMVWTGASKGSANPQYGRNIRLVAKGGDITLNTFDVSLRPTSNIIGTNGTVITDGNYLDVTIDRDYIFKTGTTDVTSELIATGNGVTSSWKNVLTQKLLDSGTINLVAGDINVNADADGIIDDVDVVGFIDRYTGKWQLVFTTPPPNTTPIYLNYNYPNVWKNTGAWNI